MCLTVPSVDQTEIRRYPDSRQRLNRALASLSQAEQNLLYLSSYQEVPVQQIAELYGLTSQAVNRRLRAIQAKLEQVNRLQLPA